MAKGDSWTADENALLQANYAERTASELLEMLPGRTWNAIHIQANKLQIIRHRWGNGTSENADLLENLSEAERGYVAGLIDGEGCISFSKRSNGRTGKLDYTLTVSVANTAKEMIDWLVDRLKGGCYITHKPGERRRLALYRWSLGNNASIALLRGIAPYLVVKQESARLLANGHRHWTPEAKAAVHARMRALKTKGKALCGIPRGHLKSYPT